MALSVPAPIVVLLLDKDRGGKPSVDYEIAGAIEEIRRSLTAQSPEEQSGAWAELAAFQFAPSHGENTSPWNTYFHPTGGATFSDGTQFHVPDIAQADTEILDYWKIWYLLHSGDRYILWSPATTMAERFTIDS